MSVSPVTRYSLESLRYARAAALADAEAFPEIFYALERIGTALTGRIAGLDEYKPKFSEIAGASPLATGLTPEQRLGHLEFDGLYEAVREGRNDALHHGVFARHLTRNAVELCLLLEDGLMARSSVVADSMVREPICAELWQPLSIVRQQMLANSFSYLPLQCEDGSYGLVADLAIARVLSRSSTNGDRKRLLALPLGDAVAQKLLEIIPAETVPPSQPLQTVLAECSGRPLLVLDERHCLVGILTPFDML